jgi:c-di-GMP-binding flagellar brake protein YcgR
MTREESQTKSRYGTVNFEKRKYPRFNIDLPVEYYKTEISAKHGRAINISIGGLLLYLPEEMKIGQFLNLVLFFTLDSEMNKIQALVEVVWTEIHPGKDWGDYRTGVIFEEIKVDDITKIKKFMRSLEG